MLRLSHEFIKILDEEMDRLRYMLYVKKEILVKENCIDQVCDQGSVQPWMLNGYLEGKDI